MKPAVVRKIQVSAGRTIQNPEVLLCWKERQAELLLENKAVRECWAKPCKHSIPRVAPALQIKLLDSKLTDTHRYWRLLLHIFQPSRNFASSLFPLLPLHTSSFHCARLCGNHGDNKGFVKRIARMRHWTEMFAWKDIECLVRVSLQKLREVGGSSCKGPLQ